MTKTIKHQPVPSHTPGPWDYDLDYIVAPDPTGRHPDIYIAEIAASDDEGRVASLEQQDFNRRLIAAATDMLNALLFWISGADLDEFDRAAHLAITQATAKDCDGR